MSIIEMALFAAAALLCNGVGIGSSLLSGMFQGTYFEPGNWYATLSKPTVWPPNFLFGPVWLSLYTVMGIGALMIIKSFGFMSIAFYLFAAQLVLNFLWSIVFFGWHKIDSAMYILIIIDLI